MGQRDPVAAAILRGQRAAQEAIDRGAGSWQDFDAPGGPVKIHPELGVPIQPIPKAALDLGTAAQRAEFESFVRGYNAEIKAAHSAGTLRDFRPRVLTAEEFEQRFAEGSSIRLPRNGKASSPDGRYLLTSSSKWRCLALQGPDDVTPRVIEEFDLDADFLFVPDGETLLVRTLHAYFVMDLPTQIVFSYQKRRDEGPRLAKEKRDAEDRERRRCTTRWSGGGERIEDRELAELYLVPGAAAEDVHLERCTLLDCRAGARPRRGDATEWAAARATIRNVTLARCELVRCGASNVLFEDVLLDGTKLGFGTALDGCLFDRVTLRGHIGSFEISYRARAAGALGCVEDVPDDVRKAHEAFYDKVSWALDLTGLKSGRVNIGDIPVELVRVNPEICFIMSREHAMSDDFRDVEGVEYTNITNDVWAFRKTTRSSLLFVANPRAKGFKLEMEALRNLRRAGLVT